MSTLSYAGVGESTEGHRKTCV